jgi:hypothetical protein
MSPTLAYYDRYGQHTGVMCLGCNNYVYVLHTITDLNGNDKLRCIECVHSMRTKTQP